MKTNIIKNLLLIALISSFSVLLSCAEDEETPEGEITGTLLGTWTGGTATINSFTINGEDISSFFETLKQLLIDFGSSESDAEALISELENDLQDEFVQTFEGTLEFRDDGTYVATEDEVTDTGTWELIDSNRAILFDKGTDNEFTMQIVSLTDDRFEGLVVENESGGDVDSDGTLDTISVSVSFVLTR